MEQVALKIIIDNPNYQLVESVHTKKGSSLYVIQLKNRVEDKFKLVSRRVEKQGGYYSGHQKGFVFNRILSENELNELFKGIFFEDKIELQKVDEEKDAWKYTTEELKSFPLSKRDDNTFVFKYKSDGNEKSYSVKVPSGSIDDAALLFGKQIIGNALLEKKYNQAVEKGEMTPVRAAQIIKSIGYSLSEINEDFIELHPDIQSVWSMKKSNESEILDKVNHPYLYERSEMSHLSDNRYSQIINNALESGKYEKLIKDNAVTANKVAFIIESAGFEIPELLLDEAIAERKEEVESLVGGFADSKSIFDISEKHNTPVKEIIKQFKKGLKVEREHTKDKKKIGEIVKDHLFENPYYYDVLIKSEKVMEEVDASKFKTHDEYMVAYSEKEKELENMPTEEKANIKARPLIDKIKYSHNQIVNGVPEEVELFLRKGILNHFVSLFNEVVSEYIFYTPVWLDMQHEYLTEEQKKKMLMYGIYNKSEYNEDSVSKFIDNVIESEMIFGRDNKKLNNIFDLLPFTGSGVPSELEYELNPKDKSLALLLDAFVNKGKILTSTLGVYFDNNGVFASKFSLDIFLKGKRGYLAKQNVEEGVYGISESAKNIFPSYGAKRLSILKDNKANKFFKDYMATYGNEKGKLEKGTSVLTHNDVKNIIQDMISVYSERAFKNYVKKELIGENPLEKGYQKNLKLKVTTYPMLYIKQGDKLFVVSFSDMIDALTAVIKMDIDTIQFGISEQGLYISEDVSSFINLEESGIRVSIKSNETEMPHGMLYFDLNKKEFLTNKLEKQEEENPEPKKEEVTSEQFQSRLKVLRKMIEKNPENKSELEVRAKVLEKMISKMSENKMNDGGLVKKNLIYLGEVGGNEIGQGASLEKAKSLEKEGISNEQIRQETGWFVNPHDKKWRFEISDEDFEIILNFDDVKNTFQNNKEIKFIKKNLSDIIKHEKMFEAYPEFNDVQFYFYNKESIVLAGVYTYESKEGKPFIIYNIYDEERRMQQSRGIRPIGTTINARVSYLPKPHNAIGGGAGENVSEFSDEVYKLRRNILIHELQHLIQIRETFGSGGSYDGWYEKLLKEKGLNRNTITSDKENILRLEAEKFHINSSGEIEAIDIDKRLYLSDRERKLIEPLSLVIVDNDFITNENEKPRFKEGGDLKKVKYRIQNEDGRFLNAGTGIDSWFNLEDARKLVDYEAGQRIVEHDGVSVLWEVF